jgi:hypothetical protein
MAANLARAGAEDLHVPPQNLDAEESVLGAMMLTPGAIASVSEILSDGREFYRESHAKIYRAALGLYAKGEPVDAITLADELDERDGQRTPLRADRPRDRDAPRPHPGRRPDRPARLGPAG